MGRNTMFHILAVVICASMLMTACNEISNRYVPINNLAQSKVVYCGGYYINASKTIPCYWIGTTRKELSIDSGHDAYVWSISVYENTVYSGGFYNDGSKDVACYWTNTVKTDLPGDGIHSSYSYAIFAVNGGVCSGGCYNDGSRDVACYWNGNLKTDLPSDGKNAYVRGIFIYGLTIYSCGSYNGASGSIPCYWVGNVKTDLPYSGNGGCANSIFVHNGVVYIGGKSDLVGGQLPCFWIGTTRTDLPDANGGEVKSIRVYDENVYLATSTGFYYNGATRINGVGGRINSIYVSDGVVYTGGKDFISNVPCYWSETEKTSLVDNNISFYSGDVTSIFVQ